MWITAFPFFLLLSLRLLCASIWNERDKKLDEICLADDLDAFYKAILPDPSKYPIMDAFASGFSKGSKRITEAIIANHLSSSDLDSTLGHCIGHDNVELGLQILSHPSFVGVSVFHMKLLFRCTEPTLIRAAVAKLADGIIEERKDKFWDESLLDPEIDISGPVLLEDSRFHIRNESFIADLFNNRRYTLLHYLAKPENQSKCPFEFSFTIIKPDRLFLNGQLQLLKAAIDIDAKRTVVNLYCFYYFALYGEKKSAVIEFIDWCEGHPSFDLTWKFLRSSSSQDYETFLKTLETCINPSKYLNYGLLKRTVEYYPLSIELVSNPNFNLRISLLQFANDSVGKNRFRLPFIAKPLEPFRPFMDLEQAIRQATSCSTLWSVLVAHLPMFKRLDDLFITATKMGGLHSAKAISVFEMIKTQLSGIRPCPVGESDCRDLVAIVEQKTETLLLFYLVKDHPKCTMLKMIFAKNFQDP